MSVVTSRRPPTAVAHVAAALLFFVGGLAITRLLFEGLFPRFLWLGRPLPVAVGAAALAGMAMLVWRVASERRDLVSAVAFSPLLINLFYLFDPEVDLAQSRFLFATSIWLTAVFLARLLSSPTRWRRLGIAFIWLALLPLYLLTMPAVAGRADTFEFQVVIPQLGIAHPTGYPLYILLGRLFAALPLGTAAWRINLASAVFAASAASFLYLAGCRLWRRPLTALLAAVLFGLSPTLWSQAVQAEVYSLHALFVAAALWVFALFLDRGAGDSSCSSPVLSWPITIHWQRAAWLLALLIGFGLTNHLTTLILIPGAVLAFWFGCGPCLRQQSRRANLQLLFKVLLAFLLPLLLYAYLPIRWQALHDEPMGLNRFIDWVVGGRFQGALQLTAWLSDSTRYGIVGRLLLVEWGWFNLGLALVGVGYTIYRSWRNALVLLITLTGYLFYALNYHVPDLAVFLIPAHAVTALFWGAGLAGLLGVTAQIAVRRGRTSWELPVGALLILCLILPTLVTTAARWPDTTFREQAALQAWGAGVLQLPLIKQSAVLADSEKIAPLYYLQQAEGLRPDLDIMVLPDEAAYRAELEARLSAGEIVYLARFLPGLEGLYHLRSQGPLTEVSTRPLEALPDGVIPLDLELQGMRLLGYVLEEPAKVDNQATAITLYWQVDQPGPQPHFVYVRWHGDSYSGSPDKPEGAHPAGNTYPTLAFREGEIVPDYHLLPRPATGKMMDLDLQVALGPQFAAAEELDWHTIASVGVAPQTSFPSGRTYRTQNGRMLLSGAFFAEESRPGTTLPILLAGYAPQVGLLDLTLVPADEMTDLEPAAERLVVQQSLPDSLVYTAGVSTDVPGGRYMLLSSDLSAVSLCGWLASPTSGCILGEIKISGTALPQGATNFDDKIGLIASDLGDETLRPGGTLPLTLHWRSLAKLDEDYTVFVQVLNEQDRIVGQVDAWPVQGTHPTSQWQPGETIEDRYEVQLAADLPPGAYRVQVGLYLLATLRRLPVVDSQGKPVDDKVTIRGLAVE